MILGHIGKTGKLMTIGMIGCGALGKAMAVTMAYKGHRLFCYDKNPNIMNKDSLSTLEAGPDGDGQLVDYLKNVDITFCNSLEEVLTNSEITFVAVQTPHDPKYSGDFPLGEDRKDFDYSHLISCMYDINKVCNKLGEDKVIAIISTTLPGTLATHIIPMLDKHVLLAYNPFFPAQTTYAQDFLNSEFVLLGIEDEEAADKLKEFYASIHDAPIMEMSIESAEITKVLYNLFISIKVQYANTVMELCHKTPNANVEDVTNTIKIATKRLISSKYLSGGMSDISPCHGRDRVAMSYYGRKVGLSHNLFDDLITAGEKQTEWFIELINKNNYLELPIVILGKAFKPQSDMFTGSAAMLLANMLKERDIKFEHFDPYVDGFNSIIVDYSKPKLYFIATKHELFKNFVYPSGSVVIDPFRYIPKSNDYNVIRIGENI